MSIVERRRRERRGTAANLAATNEVPLAGEIIVEIDTHQFKVGDGTTAYNSLPYVAEGAQGIQGPPGTPGTAALAALANRVTALETTVAAAVDPAWTVGDETTVVTDTERNSAGLTYWIDGVVGLAQIGATKFGFASNSGDSARWSTTAADFMDNTPEETDAAINTAGGVLVDDGFASGGPIYHDTANDRLIKIYHAEKYPDGSPSTSNFWSYLGLAVASESTPDTWVDMGAIISPERPFVEDEDSQAEITGGPYIITDDDEPQMLVYFKDTDTDGIWKGMGVARCPLEDVLAAAAAPDNTDPPVFTKLFGGDFTSDGLGGASDDLLPGASPNPWWFDIIHLADFDLWVMVYGGPEDDGDSLWARVAYDPLSWSLPSRLTDPDGVEVVYPSLHAPDMSPSRSITGDQIRVTYTRSVSGWPRDAPGWDRWDDASICQRLITYDPTVATGAELGPPEAWSEIDDGDLTNGWERVDPGGQAIRYRKHAGTLYLSIPAMNDGTINTSAFTLPTGYRPEDPNFERFVVMFTADTSSYFPGTVVVNPNGTVEFFCPDPTKPIMIGATLAVRLPV